MTKEQIEKYQKIENEIQPLKNLMGWCGGKYKIPGTSLLRMYLTKIWMCIPVIYRDKVMLSHIDTHAPVVIPKELQTEIVAVIENYIERREKEMEEI